MNHAMHDSYGLGTPEGHYRAGLSIKVDYRTDWNITESVLSRKNNFYFFEIFTRFASILACFARQSIFPTTFFQKCPKSDRFSSIICSHDQYERHRTGFGSKTQHSIFQSIWLDFACFGCESIFPTTFFQKYPKSDTFSNLICSHDRYERNRTGFGSKTQHSIFQSIWLDLACFACESICPTTFFEKSRKSDRFSNHICSHDLYERNGTGFGSKTQLSIFSTVFLQ